MLNIRLLLSACVEDVYVEPQPVKGINGSGIDDSFNGETSLKTKLTVNVTDRYNGKYYYTVEVFTEDPGISADARLITGGKCNSKMPFEDHILIPKVLKYIVVVVTDPAFKASLQVEVPDGKYPAGNIFNNSGGRTASSSIEIQGGDCNGNGNQPEEGGITDDAQNPDYSETNPIEYVYLFEDNWPLVGDYDMNDVVMSIMIYNHKTASETHSFTYKYTVYALGVTVSVGAGFMLNNMPAANVQGAEANEKWAVLRINNNLRNLFGAGPNDKINAYVMEHKPQTRELNVVTFNKPIKGGVNPDVFNLFIYRGDWSVPQRPEIHLPGAVGIDKALTDSESANYKFRGEQYPEQYNMMWALRLPLTKFAYYSKEGISITTSFPKFGEWARNSVTGISDNDDWYLVPNNGQILEIMTNQEIEEKEK